MKLSLIHEQDEYSDLEDADQFGDGLGPCNICDRDVPEHEAWDCRRCDDVAHYQCALPSVNDLKLYNSANSGITSSGWYFKRENPHTVVGGPLRRNNSVLLPPHKIATAYVMRGYDSYWCPRCARERNLGESSEYNDLEDSDQFGLGCDYCGAPIGEGEPVECAGGCGELITLRLCHDCLDTTSMTNMPWCNNCWRRRFGPIEESEYNDLEDADQFDYDWYCSNCDNETGYIGGAHADTCNKCGSIWCEKCLPGGRTWRHQASSPWAKNFRTYPQIDLDQDPSDSNSVWTYNILLECPHCMSGSGGIHESYENLEDDDKFEEAPGVLYAILYRHFVRGVRDPFELIVDVAEPLRLDVEFDDQRIDGFSMDTVRNLATWLGISWSRQTPFPTLVYAIKDTVYDKAYKNKDEWEMPYEWRDNPPQNWPPSPLPDWDYYEGDE